MTTELLGEERITPVSRIGYTFSGYTVADAESRVETFAPRLAKLGHQFNALYFKLNPFY